MGEGGRVGVRGRLGVGGRVGVGGRLGVGGRVGGILGERGRADGSGRVGEGRVGKGESGSERELVRGERLVDGECMGERVGVAVAESGSDREWVRERGESWSGEIEWERG